MGHSCSSMRKCAVCGSVLKERYYDEKLNEYFCFPKPNKKSCRSIYIVKPLYGKRSKYIDPTERDAELRELRANLRFGE